MLQACLIWLVGWLIDRLGGWVAATGFGKKGLMVSHGQPKHLVVPATMCTPIWIFSQHSILNCRMIVERVTRTKWNGLLFDPSFLNV
jgi:hypothetical protein